MIYFGDSIRISFKDCLRNFCSNLFNHFAWNSLEDSFTDSFKNSRVRFNFKNSLNYFIIPLAIMSSISTSFMAFFRNVCNDFLAKSLNSSPRNYLNSFSTVPWTTYPSIPTGISSKNSYRNFFRDFFGEIV